MVGLGADLCLAFLTPCTQPTCRRVDDHESHGTTKCADGSYAQKCYVAELDLTGTGLPEASTDTIRGQGHMLGGQLVLRGTVNKKSFGANGKLGVFKATEAWMPTTDAPADGVFVKLKDAGVRCITTPCPSTHELKLNASAKAKTVKTKNFVRMILNLLFVLI